MMKPAHTIPAALQEELARLQVAFVASLDAEQAAQFSALQLDAAFMSELTVVWLGSEFFFDECCKKPQWFFALFLQDADGKSTLDRQPNADALRHSLSSTLETVQSETDLMRVLREFRQQQMLCIIWRDLTRRAATLETTAALTALADVCIGAAVDFLYPHLCAEWGTPIGVVSGEPQSFLVLGMGKLGAFELNLSSDIDLIFSYDESGETQGKPRSISNRDFLLS